jgi:hypothetical protein
MGLVLLCFTLIIIAFFRVLFSNGIRENGELMRMYSEKLDRVIELEQEIKRLEEIITPPTTVKIESQKLQGEMIDQLQKIHTETQKEYEFVGIIEGNKELKQLDDKIQELKKDADV